jgi:hypothetical protein
MPLVNQPSRSYILRLWRESSAARPVWRASLTLIPDGPRLGFAGLVEVVHYLQSQLDEVDEDIDDHDVPPPQAPTMV